MTRHQPTRRAILVGAAAALPAAIVATPALAALGSDDGVDDRVLELEQQLIAADEPLQAALARLGIAEDAMAEWARRNPKPTSPPWREGEDTDAVVSVYVADVNRWAKRKKAAECGSGLAAAEAAEKAAGEKLNALIRELGRTPARTITGVTAKARAAWRHASELLRYSVIEDLIGLTPEGVAFLETE